LCVTAAECAKQRCRLIRERHWQHKADIERSEYYSRNQTENNFRHVELSSGISAQSTSEKHFGRSTMIWGQKLRPQNSVKNYMSDQIDSDLVQNIRDKQTPKIKLQTFSK
jgi:hypothetical protein